VRSEKKMIDEWEGKMTGNGGRSTRKKSVAVIQSGGDQSGGAVAVLLPLIHTLLCYATLLPIPHVRYAYQNLHARSDRVVPTR
jgi:hypothetical protein